MCSCVPQIPEDKQRFRNEGMWVGEELVAEYTYRGQDQKPPQKD